MLNQSTDHRTPAGSLQKRFEGFSQIMSRQTKAGVGSTGSNPKTFINAGAINNAFDVLDFTENIENSQDIAAARNPPNKNQSAAVLEKFGGKF